MRVTVSFVSITYCISTCQTIKGVSDITDG